MAARLLCGIVLVACVASNDVSIGHAETEYQGSDEGVVDERSSKPSLLQLQKQQKQKRCGRIPVKIFYQVRSPDCLNFINTTLRTVAENKDFREGLDIRLHPFGNAFLIDEEEISKGYHFWHPEALYPLFMCENGQMECMGNLIHKCAEEKLWYDPDPTKHLDFVICMASWGMNTSVELSSYECAQKLSIDKRVMEDVRDCVTSQHGLNLIGDVAKDTKEAEIGQVPWITVDDKHITADKFLYEACSQLEDPIPKVCPKVAPSKRKKKHIC